MATQLGVPLPLSLKGQSTCKVTLFNKNSLLSPKWGSTSDTYPEDKSRTQGTHRPGTALSRRLLLRTGGPELTRSVLLGALTLCTPRAGEGSQSEQTSGGAGGLISHRLAIKKPALPFLISTVLLSIYYSMSGPGDRT